MTDPSARSQVLVDFNASVVARFEAQADATPDAPALDFEGTVLTYRQLDARANQLAWHLRSVGVGPEVRVALCVERSPELLVGMLGILKAGGAFVPLDPAHPSERLGFMLSDSGAAVVVTAERLADELPSRGELLVMLDADAALLDAQPVTRVGPVVSGDHLAYVIYTSGSTGRPKGVLVVHRGLSNTALSAVRAHGFGPSDRVLQFASVSFDASVCEVFATLLAGATLVLAPRDRLLPDAPLRTLLREQRVSAVTLTPSVLAQLETEGLDGLRTVISAGEALPVSVARRWAGGRVLLNAYGPTEVTICAAITPSSVDPEHVTLGTPWPNARLHVLDASGEPVAVGEPGELYVGGVGVARGYLGRPDLTAERFVPDAFSGVPGARLYRTGDGVRWRADGQLEYLGRLDSQLKLRGIRIEPGEIEGTLSLHPEVREAAVVLREDSGDSRLVAFLVSSVSELESGALKAWARQRLPEHLVPSAFVALPALPLTASGKVDRSALAWLPLHTEAPALDAEGEAPRGPTEELLAQLFCQVLGLEQVSREGQFFELGGHSLSATRLAARVQQTFGVELSLTTLFATPTVAGLARVLAEPSQAVAAPLPALARRPEGGVAVPSFSQERMWFLQQLQPDSAAYIVPEAVELRGSLDVRALESALRLLLERHASLRACFPSSEGRPLLCFLDAPAQVLAVEEAPGDEAVSRRLREETSRPFSLEDGPLYRFRLFRVGPEQHVLLLVLHHLVVDGLSMAILLRELARAYGALCEQRAPELARLEVDYADVAAWQRTDAVRAREDGHLAYWKEQLSDAPAVLALPTDRPRPPVLSDGGAFSRQHRLSDSLAASLGELCRQHQVTPFMALYAAFAALLHRYSGERDLCVGTPVSGRVHPATEDVVGLFINTVVLRTRVAPEVTFASLLEQVRASSLEAFAHQEAPFERVVDALQVERSLSHSPLFQVMFDLYRVDARATAFPGVATRSLFIDNGTSQLDLALTAVESAEGTQLFFQYRTDLFDAATVERLLTHYVRLLEHALEAPRQPVGALSLLSAEERARVLYAFNDTARPFDSEATVASLFEAAVARTPDAVALVTPEVTLTFAQLASRARKLASHLAALGARPETVVGLCLERSADCVVGLLGIHLSGAACLPLEAGHPASRRAAVLRQSGACMVVSRPSFFEGAELSVPLVEPGAAELPGAALATPQRARPEHLSYVLYTSGSTGEPKGAESTQQNVVHCFDSFDPFYATHPGHTWAASGSLSFDIHQEELLFSLTRGARVVLRPLGPLGLGRDIVRHGITHIVISPSSLAVAAEEPGALEALRSLSVLVVGGEVLPDALVRQLALTKTRLVNTYGPTEASINVAAEFTEAGRPVRLGKPLARCQLYVLDEAQQPLPVGVPGEVYVGGVCLGRGYRGRPDLTAERFVPDAFSGVPGARLYRMGDRARWNEDGSLSFLGRTDFQLKVRGVRVELEEVEAALVRLPGIRQAAVIARRGPRDLELVGYLVLDASAPPVRALREALASVLPEAMVPSRLIALPSLPTTTSEKVDRKALAALPLHTEASDEAEGDAPRGATEELLAQLFCQVLGLEKVSREGHFFELGGHSLSATRLVARVRQAFSVELPLAALFASPTVAGLARVLSEQQQSRIPALPAPAPRPAGAPVVMSPAQERMGFLQQLQPDSAAYLIIEAMELRGDLEVSALESSLRLLLERHSSLRAVFPSHQPVFQSVPERVLTVENLLCLADGEESLQGLLTQRLREESSRPFSLERGPLYRFRLFFMGPQHHVLLLVVHHIVVDGLSMDHLLRELAQAYAARREQRTPLLSQPGLEYADVAAWQRTDAVREREEAQLAYWKAQLADAPAVLALPTDRPRPPVLSDRGAWSQHHRLSPALSRALSALCRQHQVTPFMALYAAFTALLHRYSGERDLCVGTPVSGRVHPATEDVVGLFINTVVLRTRVAPEVTFASLLEQVRASSLEAFAHQEAPFERVVDALQVERSLSHSPLFQVMFDLHRVDGPRTSSLPGLSTRSLFIDNGTSQLDLALTAAEGADGIEVYCQYRTDLFDTATVERLLTHYVRLLGNAVESPLQPVGVLLLLSAEERARVLYAFNDTTRPFDSEATVASLFEAAVARTPDAVALVTPEVTLTFAQLAARARKLASHLAALDARPEKVVGLCLERSADCVVGLLGIHLSGAACLPLEAGHPASRRAAVLRQSGACMVVSRPSFFEGAELSVPLVEPGAAELPGAALATPQRARPEHLSYVLYTSGSTGEPKGAESTQQNVVHCFDSFDPFYATHPGHIWAASGSLSFDIHQEELLFSLTRGARVVLRPLGPLGLGRDIVRHGITHIVISPSSLAVAAEEPGALEALRSLSVLVVGGEVLPDALVRQLALTKTRLVNTYGPTEASINVAAEFTEAGRPVRLGKPLARCQLYVLDEAQQPLPVGVPGEVYVGGVCLGRGYRGRPELTAERFVPDAFSGVPGARLYRMGDRARWNEDGSLSFLGRTDFQLKVRGVRVELEEVEAALVRLPGVRQAAVIARRGPRDLELVGYLVLDASAPPVRALREALASVLPEAMVPSRLIALPSLPTTTSEKVDRKALAALPLEAAPESEAEAAFEPPHGPTEELLAQLFCQVLGLEKVSREGHFFELGGHSLSATRLVARVRQAFSVELPLAALFASPTVAGLARALSEHSRVTALPAPTPRPPDAPPVLSYAQERMWFLHQLQPGLSAYHIPESAELLGELDAGALESSLRLLLERHPVLRLTISAQEGRPVPRLSPLPERVLSIEDCAPASWQRRLEEQTARPFSMESGPLFRFSLFRLAPRHHVLLLVLHHLLVDGLSMDVLMRELSLAYEALRQQRRPALPSRPLDSSAVAEWQRTPAVRELEDAHVGWWKQQLSGAPALLSLPTDKPRPAVLGDAGALSSFLRLPSGVSKPLAAFCRQHQVTPFMVLHAALAALLHRYSGQDDVCVGTPVSGRPHPDMEEVVGLFTNTVVLRTRVTPEQTFTSLLSRVRATALESFAHQEAPFERVVEALDVERSLSHAPLFQVAFIWERAEQSLTHAFPGVEARPVAVDSKSTQFELALTVSEDARGHELSFQYSTELFEPGTIDRLLSHYVRLLEHALAAPELPVGSLPLLDAEERRHVVHGFNATQASFDTSATLVSLLEAQVERTPDAPALTFEGDTLSYRALDARANQLAWHLRSLGAGPESLVGVCLERSVDLVVALLAVLKSGAAYVPLDPAFPRERLAAMLEDCGAPVLLTHQPLLGVLPAHAARPVCLDVEAPTLSRLPTTRPAPLAGPESLAYVIFTSGSTGRPKGAMNAHRGVVNRLLWMQREYGLTAADTVLQKTPFSFDVSVWEFFWPLMTGARLVLARPGGHQDPAYLVRLMAGERVTTVHFVPSMLRAFVEEPGLEGLTELRRLVCSGEALPAELVRQVYARMPATEVHNLYGPTEAAVDVTSWRCRRGDTGVGVPIGRPVANTRIHVLDSAGQPVPVGVPGELFIGGVQVGRGYWRRPELTAERFVPDALSDTPGARLYRTGDLARWRADGAVEYLGRTDFQVKVRGLRIELEDIESALRRQPSVRDAVVMARTDAAGDTQLVAYVVTATPVEEAALRQALAAVLPGYMVPSRCVFLDALPLTPSGKVDRKALPIAELAPPTQASEAPPRGPLEQLLAQLFGHVLGLERVSRDADFFALGGHSLSATRLAARIRQALGVELPLKALFTAPTVAGLARLLAEPASHAGALPLPAPLPRPEGTPTVPSFSQERMWFLQQLQPDSAALAVPEAAELHGPLDVSALESALRLLVERHASLRTTFPSTEGRPQLAFHPVPAHVLDVEALPHEALLERRLQEETSRLFSLEDGPLYRFRLFQLAPEHHVLLLVLHHLVVDGISMDVLLRELARAHADLREQRAPVLPSLPLDYADIAVWQRTPAVRAREEAHLAYWRQQLSGAPSVLELPTDRPRLPGRSSRGAFTRHHALPAGLGETLRELCRQHHVTPFMALYAAFASLLQRYSGQAELCVGTPVSGRSHPATEGLVGLFINTVVLRTRVAPEASFAELLEHVRGVSLDAFTHQEAPFERVVDALGVERSLSHSPLFQVMFELNPVPRTLADGFPELRARPVHLGSGISLFDLVLTAVEDGPSYTLYLQYHTDLYEPASAERMMGHYVSLLEGALRSPTAPVGLLPLLSAAERQQVLVDFNASETPLDASATAVSLFSAQAALTPDAVALAFEGQHLTYAELDARSNQLARFLRSRYVGPEVRVALCLERSAGLVISMLAVLKAGGAFISLDASAPPERLEHLLADSGAMLLVTQEPLEPLLSSSGRLTVRIDADAGAIERMSEDALPPVAEPDQLAYVIYTSGSTGQPKGVLLAHRGLCNTALAAIRAHGLKPGRRMLQFASASFDGSIWETFSTLLSGATLVLAPREKLLPDLPLRSFLREQRITDVALTPSVLTLLETEGLEGLETVISAGEALPPEVARRWAEGRNLLNSYGPTEVTVAATLTAPPGLGRPAGTVTKEAVHVTLGTPWPNTRLYVLDARQEPLPVGIPGELYVGGVGLARGYLGQPELTAERFVPDSFSGLSGARLYRTGDRVRWLADGRLEYLGRFDTQLKLRGIRVEPGEIEAALVRHPEVREAAVVPREDASGDTRLVAFLVPVSSGAARDSAAVRAWLKQRLPEHLVPSAFATLDALPLNASGKVDRRALASLPLHPEAPQHDAEGEPPRGPTEAWVAQLFCQVLGLERVSREGHFFELGGHSLSATRLVARIRQAFGVELPLASFFALPTVAALAALVESAPRSEAALVAGPRPEQLPASVGQERLWYALQLPDAPPYVLTLGLVLEGPLDTARLEAALTAVVERNETLRTTFHQKGESVLVRVHPVSGPVLAQRDFSHLPPAEALAAAKEVFARQDQTHFDLLNGPLYRFELLRLDAEGTRHALVMAFSHLVNDGVGLETFADELASAWRAAREGTQPLLPPLAFQFTDYALWQRRPEQLRRLDEGLASWRQALAQAPAVLDLPLDFPRRAPALNANMRPVHVTLSPADAAALTTLARREGVSVFTALLALTQAWLHRLSGQGHVVVASPFSGRSAPQVEKLMGYFANVLPLCTDVSGGPSFRALLGRVQATVAHATAHQEVPFKRIADAVQPDAPRTAPPLAQALLLAEHPGLPTMEGLRVSELDFDGVIPAYDVVVSVAMREGGPLRGLIATDSLLFNEASGERFARAWEQLAAAAVHAPDVPLSRLPMLTPAQRAHVLAALEGPERPLPASDCIHGLFEAQVLRTPAAPAVADRDVTWSYASLNARANLLAKRLREHGLLPEERVGVVMEPSAQAMAVLLGILKAGGTYVPLDAGWPEPRKRTVLERAGVQRLWVDAAVLAEHEALVPLVEVPPRPEAVPGDLGPSPYAVSGAQLAYIVFTSGSTGEPKGVMVEHRSVVNHNTAIAERFRLGPGDRMLQFAPLTFDAAAEDLYPPLAVGATVVMRGGLVPAHTMTPYLEEMDITVISLPPTYIEEWIRQMDALGQRVPARLELLAPGGDVLKRETYEAWVRVGGGHAPWVNVYGPTECTITSATCDIPGDEGVGSAATFPIGRPIPRVRFYLLDEHLEPVLPGMPGRVYIGGAALSRGYLGAPDATSERFIPDPFSTTPGARMYHTGDLARLLPDGRLRFLGRADHQVKVRGFRIELSEIETCLRRHPGVEEAVVVARTPPSGVTSLCAYVQAPGTVKEEALRAHVAAQLPGYMVPAAFVVMEALPLNANGKVDRHALPEPEAVQPASPPPADTAKLETPFRTSLEMVLQRLWQEVLGRQGISAADDFFALGGDSILAMRVLARLEEELGLPLPLATLFQSPSLGESAEAIQALLEEGPRRTSVVRLSGAGVPRDAPPLFLFHAGDGEVHHYRDLVPRLEPRFRCYGLQAPESLSSGHGHATFEARVEAYTADVRAVQPHGPYRLVGFSYGGYPALGVAAALEAQGETVELLSLVDTATSELIEAASPVARGNPVLAVAEEFDVRDEALERELAPLPLAKQWELLAERARARGTAAAHFRGSDFARIWHVLGEVLAPQARAWRVPSLRTPVRLFTTESTRTHSGDALLGWTRHLPPGQLHAVALPGEHAAVLHPPLVDALARHLLSVLAGE